MELRLTCHWVYRKAIEYHEKHLKIAKEIGDRGGELSLYLGNAYLSLGDLCKAIEYHEITFENRNRNW